MPVVTILDNIRSFHNVGAVFRVSDAFRLEHLYLCGITPKPPHRDIRKTALGAEESVDWTAANSAATIVHKLRADGYKVYAVEQAEGGEMLDTMTLDINQKYALVFGHEVNGVSDEVMQIVDGSIEIPQEGTKHSLNISVTAGIIIWQLFKLFRSKL